LNDAWELAKKIAHYTKEGLLDRFGTIEIMIVFEEFTYKEALAKLKAYEEAQKKIEIGDVVECNYHKIVITSICGDEVWGIDNMGITFGTKMERCKKTGKHLELASILEQIGE
jgi:hypothetical protein